MFLLNTLVGLILEYMKCKQRFLAPKVHGTLKNKTLLCNWFNDKLHKQLRDA